MPPVSSGGANIITHSTTKFIGGHGTTIGGIIVDGGNFDWTSGRFDNFTTPDPSYHGLVYAGLTEMGLPPYAIKARVQILRDIGAARRPYERWTTLQGVETLSLRMDRHVANAQAVAEFLEGHEDVDWVSYPGLASHPAPRAGQEISAQGAGRDPGLRHQRRGPRQGKKFIDSLQLLSHVANVGDAKSLAIHPARRPTAS